MRCGSVCVGFCSWVGDAGDVEGGEFGRGFLMGVVNAASDNEVISVLREV